jgi:glucose/arabinose dehydrogenase
MKQFLLTIAAVACACSSSSSPEPEIIPGQLAIDFERVPYATAIDYVTDMAFLPGGSSEFLAIDLYGGFEHARLGPEGAESLMSGRFEGVYADFDAGQLGIAIDPGFETNSLFYVATNLSTSRVQIRRYTFDRESFERTRDSEVVILDFEAGRSPRWHNITSMGFEQGGAMWALVGDKGLFEPAQDETNILGALIRIVPSRVEGTGGYTIPEDAPAYSSSADPAVHSIGIRSPWKGVYYGGQWFFGDVGLDDVEEVNVIEAPGQNFGWPVVEGLCDDDVLGNDPDCALYDDPIIAYGRSSSEDFVRDDGSANPTNKRSVYVGWIYEPNDNDPYEGLWDDVMVFGDAYVGFMRAATIDEPEASWHIGHMTFPTAWAQAPDGYVYVTSYSNEPPDEPGTGQPESRLYRIVSRVP